MPVVAMRIENASVVIEALVNGHPCDMILDSGDSLGPTFNQADATRLGLVKGTQEGVSGAGGASEVWTTTATIALGSAIFTSEPGAIDAALQGPSLLGLPFFLSKCDTLIFGFSSGELMLG